MNSADLRNLRTVAYSKEKPNEWLITVIKQIIQDSGVTISPPDGKEYLILALAKTAPEICHFCQKSFRPCHCENDD